MPTTHPQNSTNAPQTEDTQTARAASPKSVAASRSTSPRKKRAKSTFRSNEQAGRERLHRTLSQKKGPNTVMTGILSGALLLGLLGLAVPFFWVVAIIVMALGLGFAIANGRRDRIDVMNQRADDR